MFYHDGLTARLSHKAEHFGMSVLSEDNDLRIGVGVELFLDALLQLQHHRASGINYLDVVAPGKFVGFGWLAMCAQQHFHIVQFTKLLVVDGGHTHSR